MADEFFAAASSTFAGYNKRGRSNTHAEGVRHAARFTIVPSRGQGCSARKAAWVNADAYTAHLAAALVSYGAALSRAIFSALEFDRGGKEPNELQAAAQLFEYAASELYSGCREDHPTIGSQAHQYESGKHE
ncbi:hypothetical protein DL764_003141 [Monosporascus ibericus]|uniref:Uncharacterized protein n=1 Tax=Monosporascus ibericus TaxID=155417 RepID=A0A4Q4TLQ6_9PEZI|nr:hypothetical protein DL764_003141 [Monosporascus ibericus]